VANIQPCPGYSLPALDPEGVAEIAAKLRAQADLFDHTLRPTLIAARKEWAAQHTALP
jgi:hypothetical protein